MNRLNQKGQGTTEYIVIVGIIVVIAIALNGPLKSALDDGIKSIASQIKSATSGGGN